ncbi:hypothetical protein [Pedobacter sp. SL55]|uniref:hypothetical protein n=1 Tax=Pedobacter sp. SL55 TaxID=2995161 RepID=UPI0022714627|nr:hypothetical protein [Pedobacter sp. SL55]WAC40394.1 hypothetical protein OVA16_17765 [Pedobacter sp. SL55]
MKIKLNILLLVTCCWLFTACKKKQETEPEDNSPVAQQMGFNKKYTSLTVTPLSATESASQDFLNRWYTARSNTYTNAAGRQIDSFVIRFISENQLTMTLSYRFDTGIATALFTYDYVRDADGNITMSLSATNTNADTLAPYLTTLTTDYLSKYKFKIDWITDKLPNSKPLIAAFYRTDNVDSYFYGTIN